MTDTDLNWATFDQARGLHPRQRTMTATQQANANPAVALSPAAQAQVKLIQKEAGLPQTGQLDPRTVAYAKQAYAKQISGGGGGGSKSKSKKSKSKKSKSSSSSSKSKKAKTAKQLLQEKKKAARIAARKAAAQKRAIQRKETQDEYNWEKGELKNERSGGVVHSRNGKKSARVESSGTLFKQATTTAAQTPTRVGRPVPKKSKHGGHRPHKPGQRATRTINNTATAERPAKAGQRYRHGWIPITKADLSTGDARRSREVSPEEFQRIASVGAAQYSKLKRHPSPTIFTHGSAADRAKIAELAYKESRPQWGGSTIDAHTGKFLETDADKYAITVRDPGMDTTSIPASAGPEEFHKAYQQAIKKYDHILQRKDHHLGVFHDADKGTIDIDPVYVTPKKEHTETIGAYTRNVGGAYHFKSKDGFWPPHVSTHGKVSLSTPIGGTQDGPRMTKTFGGKKAAPFKKGGGRSAVSPRDAKGRKRAVAKAVARKRAMGGGTLDNAAPEVRRAAVDLAVSPNGRPMDTRPLGKPGSKRQLSDYERGIAHALMRKGMPKSRAIAMARGLTNTAARSGRWGRKGKASAATIAGSAASIAQRASFSVGPDGKYREYDLAAKWHHGFIPANAEAVAIKEHKAHGEGPESGKKALASYKKFHSDATKRKMTITDLRAHASEHSAAAERARTLDSKRKHLKEAQDSLNTIQAKRDDRTKRSVAKEITRTSTKKASAKKAATAAKPKVKTKSPGALRPKDDVTIEKSGASTVPHVAGAERDLDPHELLREIKEAKDAKDTKRIKVLKAEVKRRVALAATAKQHAEKAKELIDTDWDKAKGDPVKEKRFFAKLTKLMPVLSPKLAKIKNSNASSVFKDKEYLKIMIDEAFRIIVDKLVPAVLGSALGTIGLGTVGALLHTGG